MFINTAQVGHWKISKYKKSILEKYIRKNWKVILISLCLYWGSIEWMVWVQRWKLSQKPRNLPVLGAFSFYNHLLPINKRKKKQINISIQFKTAKPSGVRSFLDVIASPFSYRSESWTLKTPGVFTYLKKKWNVNRFVRRACKCAILESFTQMFEICKM